MDSTGPEEPRVIGCHPLFCAGRQQAGKHSCKSAVNQHRRLPGYLPAPPSQQQVDRVPVDSGVPEVAQKWTQATTGVAGGRGGRGA